MPRAVAQVRMSGRQLRVKGDRLCMVHGLGGAGCYEVLMSGAAVQLRPENEVHPMEEGTLVRP